MTSLAIPWGREELRLDLPAGWKIDQTVRPNLKPAPSNWPDRVAEALSQPTTGQPLGKLLAECKGKAGRVALLLQACPASSPLSTIVELILREARHAGLDNGRIDVIFATGMRRALPPERMVQALGQAGEGLTARSNPVRDRAAHVRIGRTGKLDVLVDRAVAEADLRILVSSVRPHVQTGFEGGYQLVVPGCASLETIHGLYRIGLAAGRRRFVGGIRPDNPMRRAIDAAGQLLDDRRGASFALTYLPDEQGLPAILTAGQPLPTQQMMAKHCANACGVVTNVTADVLLVNAYPRDYDFWQTFRSIPDIFSTVRPGGPVVCFGRCDEGFHGVRRIRWPLGTSATRRLLRRIGPDNLAGLLRKLLPRLAGDDEFFVRLAAQTLARNPVLLVSPVLAREGLTFPGVDVYETPDQALRAAETLAPQSGQRVVVFPLGGLSYPVRTMEHRLGLQ